MAAKLDSEQGEQMGLYLALGGDDPVHGPARREAFLNDHRTYVRGNDANIRMVGPLLQDDGKICGSMYIFEAENEGEVRDWFSREPFFNNGVYKDLLIKGFYAAKNELEPHGWP